MKITIILSVLFIVTSCGGSESAASKTENSTCVDSAQVEMFDAQGKAYYVWMPCDSLND